jgi:hypothetical protein
MNDLELIRRYEPVLRFSRDDAGRDEAFFPMAVDHYVAQSALSRKRQGVIRPRGTLTLDELSRFPASQSRELYLTFVAADLLEHDPSLRQRLAHGGLSLYSIDGTMTPQLVVEDPADVAFALSDPGLEPAGETGPDEALAFGMEAEFASSQTVYSLVDAMQLPAALRESAVERYAPFRDFERNRPVYYYHLLYNRGYRVLQYWFFYPFNDWGSGHDGMNDHEGDWELIALFFQEGTPRHVAYSAHIGKPGTHTWSDGNVTKWDDTHPVVYVASGSHANYFCPGSHTIATFKDCSYGNSSVSIGPGTGHPWGDPRPMRDQPWLHNFAGGWGALVKRFGTSWLAPGAQAPVGPAWQFKKWESPVAWANLRW